MRNPWLELPESPPFVLECDREMVVARNRAAPDDVQLQVEVLPHPYVGNVDAPVVLLNLNPAYSDDDPGACRDPYFQSLVRANLRHEPIGYPFYFLDPEGPAPGRRWWSARLGPLIKEVGLETAARRLLCIEYFPYPSRRYRRLDPPLPSQRYGFWLARRAIERGAMIIIMRGETAWLREVPELAGYEKVYRLNSVQNVTVSPGNCPVGFDVAVEALKVGDPWR